MNADNLLKHNTNKHHGRAKSQNVKEASQTTLNFADGGYSLATKLLNLSMVCAKFLTCNIFCHVACIHLFQIVLPAVSVTTDNDSDISHDAIKILPLRQNDILIRNSCDDAWESKKGIEFFCDVDMKKHLTSMYK